MNNSVLMVCDTETTGRNPATCEIIELAAIALNPRTLKPYQDGEFQSLSKPPGEWTIEPGAQAKHGITKEMIEGAPDEKAVWQQFITFAKRFNLKGNKYSTPILCGHNFWGYDRILIERLCNRYHTDYFSFFSLHAIDTMHLNWAWHENNSEVMSLSMDNLKKFYGLGNFGKAHSALSDCKATAVMLTSFLNLHRNLSKKITFANSLKDREI